MGAAVCSVSITLHENASYRECRVCGAQAFHAKVETAGLNIFWSDRYNTANFRRPSKVGLRMYRSQANISMCVSGWKISGQRRQKRTKHGRSNGIELGLLLVPLSGELLPQGLPVGLFGDTLGFRHLLRLFSNLLVEVNLSAEQRHESVADTRGW